MMANRKLMYCNHHKMFEGRLFMHAFEALASLEPYEDHYTIIQFFEHLL